MAGSLRGNIKRKQAKSQSANLDSPNDVTMNNLDFTLDRSWQPTNSTRILYNGSLVSDSVFQTELLNMTALFGIFEALDYRSWRSVYGNQHNLTNITASGYDPSLWMCNANYSSPCTESAAATNASDWIITPENIPIDYCLSKHTPGEICQLEYSSFIISFITGCDFIKALVILAALRLVKDPPLVTIGDSIAAFLKKPESILGHCLLDQERALSLSNFNKFFWFLPYDSQKITRDRTIADIYPEIYSPFPIKWAIPHKRWYHAPSRSRWTSFLAL